MAKETQRSKLVVRRAKGSDAARLAQLAGELGYPTTSAQMKQRLRLILENENADTALERTQKADLRSLVPLDMDTVVASVRKTAKALVVHEDKVFSGFGGEIASQISEKCFDCLDGPVLRVGSEYTPVPFAKILERAVLPQVDDVVKRALELAKY